MQARFHPAPNPSPASAVGRVLVRLPVLGPLAVGAALAAAALLGWMLPMAVASAWAARAGAALSVPVVVAMAGLAYAACAAGLGPILQVGSVRRAKGLR
jgi:hypothetical protein